MQAEGQSLRRQYTSFGARRSSATGRVVVKVFSPNGLDSGRRLVSVSAGVAVLDS